MSQRRKIAIYTGNRAEYGLQFPIIQAVQSHPELEAFLIVSGAHLDTDFGRTLGEIEKDGFKVHALVDFEMKKDTVFATTDAIGRGIVNLAPILDRLKPDLMVVYADRFEGFSALITSSQMNIPTAHIEGGDLTEGGALDDSVRHAMTKLAHLHFTTNADARERILRLGEEEWRVHNVGFPMIDLIRAGKFASPDELVKKYGIDLKRPVLLFTQHSVTTEFEKAAEQIRPSLDAFRVLAREGYQVILTYPNNDAGGRAIIRELEEFAKERIPGVQVIPSLGRWNYHGFLNLCGKVTGGACVGNSSSGIKETPAFSCPAINIGSRQDGRLRAENVMDAPYDRERIIQACRQAVEDRAFREQCARVVNPYGAGNSGPLIAEQLARVQLGPKLLQKRMTY